MKEQSRRSAIKGLGALGALGALSLLLGQPQDVAAVDRNPHPTPPPNGFNYGHSPVYIVDDRGAGKAWRFYQGNPNPQGNIFAEVSYNFGDTYDWPQNIGGTFPTGADMAAGILAGAFYIFVYKQSDGRIYYKKNDMGAGNIWSQFWTPLP